MELAFMGAGLGLALALLVLVYRGRVLAAITLGPPEDLRRRGLNWPAPQRGGRRG